MTLKRYRLIYGYKHMAFDRDFRNGDAFFHSGPHPLYNVYKYVHNKYMCSKQFKVHKNILNEIVVHITPFII